MHSIRVYLDLDDSTNLGKMGFARYSTPFKNFLKYHGGIPPRYGFSSYEARDEALKLYGCIFQPCAYYSDSLLCFEKEANLIEFLLKFG